MSDKMEDPSDLELMLYADGELDADRVAAVEALLARDEAAQKKLRALDVASSVIRERAEESAPSIDIADLVMASIAKEAKAEPLAAPPPRAPSNDNARGPVWAIFAIAVAAAAAFLMWGRAPADSVATKPTVSAPREDATSSKPEPSRADDVGPGVEVSAVDFGALTGSLFYVLTGAASSETTTVVWLSGDSGGGDE